MKDLAVLNNCCTFAVEIISNITIKLNSVMKERWYRSDFDDDINGEKHYHGSEYFVAKDDDAAIKYAKHLASEGWDYIDAGHVDGDLLSVTLVDSENEFVDIKTIWE